MRSVIYRATVSHTRLRPRTHAFRYRVFYGLFDLAELDTLDRELRLFGYNRPGIFAFYDRDHGPDDGSDLRAWIDGLLSDAGVDLTGGSVQVLAFPRVLGYVFNPISVWYCHSADGRLVAVLHEVRNTFGDKHSYLHVLEGDDLSHGFAKEMHVSPFMPMDQRYEFSLVEPGRRVAVGIRQFDDEGEIFRAGLRGTAAPLTDSTLARLFFTHPLVTFKAIAAIHYQALRIWMKRIAFHRRPTPPLHEVTSTRSVVA